MMRWLASTPTTGWHLRSTLALGGYSGDGGGGGGGG